jgi:hypothetical protein
MTLRTVCWICALCACVLRCGGKAAEPAVPDVGPPAALTHTLRVARSGSGAVVSTPAGIDCGVTCSATFVAGTTVLLSQAAALGYSFDGWDGACGGNGTCSVTLNADATVGAHFSTLPPQPPPAKTYVLRVTIHGTGTVKSTPGGIDCGQTCAATFGVARPVTLTATADAWEGWRFSAWSGACSGAGNCTVTLGADTDLEATFEPTPPPPSPGSACDGLMPATLPSPVVATLPKNGCQGGTSDDGIGNFLLGYTAGAEHTFPAYLFFTIKDGKAERIGDAILGSDVGGLDIDSQPSGFSSFFVFGPTDSSTFSSYNHEGVRTATMPVVEGDLRLSQSSRSASDPSGGTAILKTSRDSSGSWRTTYRRLDKTGVAETGWVTVDTGKTVTPALAVALSGHVLLLESLEFPGRQARWLDREGTPLTGWFAFTADEGFPEFRFLPDGSLVLRFVPPRYPIRRGPWKYRVEDGQAAVSLVPPWLAARGNGPFYVVRGGRGYVSWGGEGQCGLRLEVLAASGESCGCVAVPSLSDLTSVGRDGSLIVPRAAMNFGTCQYDLYPQLFQ